MELNNPVEIDMTEFDETIESFNPEEKKKALEIFNQFGYQIDRVKWFKQNGYVELHNESESRIFKFFLDSPKVCLLNMGKKRKVGWLPHQLQFALNIITLIENLGKVGK